MEVLFAWAARSPDLNPLDFHLWARLKSIVYATWIENAEILRNRIEQGFRQIRENTRNDRESNRMNDKTRVRLVSKCEVVVSLHLL